MIIVDRSDSPHLSGADMLHFIQRLKPMELKALVDVIVEEDDDNSQIALLLKQMGEKERVSGLIGDIVATKQKLENEQLQLQSRIEELVTDVKSLEDLLSGKEFKKQKNDGKD